MEKKREPTVRQRLVHASCGGFLIALAAVFFQLRWAEIDWTDINWWVVAVCAVFGFLLAWLFGDEAIELLKFLSWWS